VAQDRERASPFTLLRDARISCEASPSWSSSGRSRPGRVCAGSQAREIFRKFRTPGEGEKLILEGNAFVERVLPGGMRHKLTDEEMAVYRAPFPTSESHGARPGASRTIADRRRACRCLCDDGAPHAALAASTHPKLLFAAEPGGLVPLAFAQELAGNLKDCQFVELGDGIHFLQEDHPETIGRSVAAFIAEVESRKGRDAA
jgi:haloalkane dehalogenase